MEPKTELLEIIRKRWAGEPLSDDEQENLHQWKQQNPHAQQLLNESGNEDWLQAQLKAYHQLNTESRWDKLLPLISAAPKKTIPLHRFKWIAAAAALIIIVTTTWLLFNKNVASNPQQISKADIPPGHNGAILTLADGSKIILDSTANGAITTESNTTIHKNNDGTIAYIPNAQRSTPGSQLEYNQLTTPPGRQFSIILPDGSKVWLNAASSLRYPAAFNGSERTVELTGEAYFEITARPNKPFYVKSASQQIQVLGTSFNINAYANEPDTKTTLLEGAIRLSSLTPPPTSNSVIRHLSSVILKPGQQASIQQTITINNSPDLTKALAWKNGLFSFQGLTIGEAMRQIERWYNIKVEYKGSASGLVFGGEMYRNVNLSDVLDMLKDMGVKYEWKENTLIIL